jgi:hypothetical protein
VTRFLTLFVCYFLVGCAAITVLPVEDLALSEKTSLEDLRPAIESTREIFSLLVTSEKYGYSRLAEDITTPTGARLFAHRLQEQFPGADVPPIKLYRFVVYKNIRAEGKAIGFGAIFGVVGAVVASASVNRDGEITHRLVDAEEFSAMSGEDEYKRAIYTEDELNPNTSGFTIYIESETQGRRRFTKTVAPTQLKKTDKMSPIHQALEAAIAFHLSQ